MSKVITFSRKFPSYHPKAGEPTHFVEAIMNSLYPFLPAPKEAVKLYDNPNFQDIGAKHHTIRAGHRFKVGDWFSPRVWSSEPYNSKQIIIAPDIQIPKLWNIIIDAEGLFFINGDLYAYPNSDNQLSILANNDGLDTINLLNWFYLSPDYKKKKEFDGQIICWNENIEY